MRYHSPSFKTVIFFGLLYLLIPSSMLLAQDDSNNAHKATPNWVVSTDFISQSRGTGLVVDSFGNSYSTGYFSDKVWLEDSIYVDSCGSVKLSKNNYFLSKRDTNGTLLWIRYGIGSARSHKILLGDLGNVYVIGHIWGNSLQLSSTKDSMITKNKSYLHSNQSSIFICQYNPKGKVLRAKILPSQKGQVPNDCVLDAKGNLFIGGHHNYSSPDAPNRIKCRYSLLKLNASWDILWSREGTMASQSQIYAIALDTHSNIYVTGGFRQRILFSKDSLKGHHNENNIFVVQYNQDGVVQWVLDSLVSTPSSVGLDLVFDQQQNLYVLIHTQHSKAFLIKFNSQQEQIWSKAIEGRQTINGLLVDAKNHIYLFGNGYTGNFGTTKYADKSLSYNDYGSYNFFIAKYNSHGSLLSLNLEGKGGLNYCQGIALYKDKILVLGTSNAGRELHFGSYIKKVEWYYNIWLAAFNQDEFNLESQDK